MFKDIISKMLNLCSRLTLYEKFINKLLKNVLYSSQWNINSLNSLMIK